MEASTFKPVEISIVATVKESIDFTIKNIGHVLKVQWSYFVTIILLELLLEHLGSQMGEADISGLAKTGITQVASSVLHGQIVLLLRYVLDIIYVNTLYEWLAFGGELKPFYAWPISKNVWSRMWLDVRIAFASLIPMLVAGLIAIPFGLSLMAGGDSIVPAIAIGLLILIGMLWSLYRGAIYVFATPTIYEPKKLSLMKDFWPATKGNRAKLLGWSLLVCTFILLIGGAMAFAITNDVISGASKQPALFHLGHIFALAVTACSVVTTLFGTYFVVAIWKKLRTNVPKLNEPASAS